MSEQTVAVLGLGIIGSIWASHYQSEGQLVATWNRSVKPNLPFPLVSLQACSEEARVLHICLYDADSVAVVLERLIPHLGPQHVVIQSSTIDGKSATQFAAMVQATGARYLEAPFTGSKPSAEKRETVFFLGGDAEVIESVEPLLKTLSVKRFHIGSPMQAATIKLAMNLQIASLAQALCESITLSRQANIDDDCFFDVMKQNVAWSGLAALKEPKLRENDLSPQFSVKNMHKDMRLAQKSAEQSFPLLETVRNCLTQAEAAGYGEDDFIALIRALETK
jgi:3-hydroxyisobutyrate dehydrogenase